jgi:hypothetical protein
MMDLLLTFPSGVSKKNDSDDNKPGKNQHKIPERKEKTKRENLLTQTQEKKENNQGAEIQAKQEQTLSVIGRLSAPGLRGWLAAAHHVLAHAALTDVHAEFK